MGECIICGESSAKTVCDACIAAHEDEVNPDGGTAYEEELSEEDIQGLELMRTRLADESRNIMNAGTPRYVYPEVDPRLALQRLADFMAEETMAMTDEEIMEEMLAEMGSEGVEQFVQRMRKLAEDAIAKSAERRSASDHEV
jgi:flagellar basal body rod protein FlgB